MKISIIIPVYNSEQYLRACIDSVLEQSYTDFELLLINDGSSDASGKICDEYALKDARVKAFHKENGGVSSARNLGLDHAKGEWVCFVDSDDFVSDVFLKEIIQELYSSQCDILIQPLTRVVGGEYHMEIMSHKNNKLQIEEFLKEFNVTIFGYVAGKAYRNMLLKSNKIKFDQDMTFGEDCDFFINYLNCCETVFMSNKSNYFYRQITDSLTRKELNFDKEYTVFLKINKSLQQLSRKYKINVENQIIYYTKRLILSIFQDHELNNVKRKRIDKISFLLNNHKREFLNSYAKAKVRGKLFYYLLKFRQIFLFELAYRKLR